MSIDVPTPGGPILDTWGAAVAGQLNAIQAVCLDADVTTDSASAQDVTGLAFDTEAGRNYMVQLWGVYTVSSTAKGLKVSFTYPGGTGQLHLTIYGNGSDVGLSRHRTNGYLGAGLQGRTSTDSTGYREWRAQMWWQASADGTLQLQFGRGGSSGGTGVTMIKGTGLIAVGS